MVCVLHGRKRQLFWSNTVVLWFGDSLYLTHQRDLFSDAHLTDRTWRPFLIGYWFSRSWTIPKWKHQSAQLAFISGLHAIICWNLLAFLFLAFHFFLSASINLNANRYYFPHTFKENKVIQTSDYPAGRLTVLSRNITDTSMYIPVSRWYCFQRSLHHGFAWTVQFIQSIKGGPLRSTLIPCIRLSSLKGVWVLALTWKENGEHAQRSSRFLSLLHSDMRAFRS